jgi:N-methylhydantoinase B
VLTGSVEDDTLGVDDAATAARRAELAAARTEAPMFDRGPGYATLAGATHAEVDRI